VSVKDFLEGQRSGCQWSFCFGNRSFWRVHETKENRINICCKFEGVLLCEEVIEWDSRTFQNGRNDKP
jgi:hypothetical protein